MTFNPVHCAGTVGVNVTMFHLPSGLSVTMSHLESLLDAASDVVRQRLKHLYVNLTHTHARTHARTHTHTHTHTRLTALCLGLPG